MSISAATLQRLVAVGLSKKQMAEVIAILVESEQAEERRRLKQRERKSRSRDKSVTVTGLERDGHCDGHGHSPAPKERSPTPSRETTPSSEGFASLTSSAQQNFSLIEEPEPLTNGSGAYPEDFEDLWREYRVVGPKTSSKSSAHKAFAKLSQPDRKACWSGVVNYAVLVMDERKRRADYPVKHLATFINERGWEPFLEDVA